MDGVARKQIAVVGLNKADIHDMRASEVVAV
jgi:hypothetical protein